MVKSILIGLDGSNHSRVAIELGLQWAQRFSATVIGLGIVDEATIRKAEPVPLGASYYKQQRADLRLEEARRQVERCLDRFAARCRESGVECGLLEDIGIPYEEILRESRRYDLVLLGHHTHFQYGAEERPDQTLRTVLRHTSRPVVTVPETLGEGKGVVVAYNGRQESDHALQAFRATGLDFGERVFIVSIDADLDWASRCAKHAAHYLKQHRIDAVAAPVKQSESAGRAILDYVNHQNARLLVMGAYGRSILRERLLGSVTDTVLGEARSPVFLCH